MSPRRVHLDRVYEQELRDLREKLLAMGGHVERQISQGVEALVERESAVAREVRATDADVDRLEVEVDELCRRMLALRQPAAVDLRFITTALKIVVDLSRMGDLAVHIAACATELNDLPPLRPLGDLAHLGTLVQAQVKAALDAFVHADAAEAEAVLRQENSVNAYFQQSFDSLLALMSADPRHIRRAYALMSVCRHLERVGDHCTNVAEMVVFLVRGQDIRHRDCRPLGQA